MRQRAEGGQSRVMDGFSLHFSLRRYIFCVFMILVLPITPNIRCFLTDTFESSFIVPAKIRGGGSFIETDIFAIH